jgi:hypothetical protein
MSAMHEDAAVDPRPLVAELRRQLEQRTAERDEHGAELDQYTVAGGFDDRPAVLGDRGARGGAMLAQCQRRPRLVLPHQPAVADHIGGEDRGETAGPAHAASPTAKRKPDRYSSRCSGLR